MTNVTSLPNESHIVYRVEDSVVTICTIKADIQKKTKHLKEQNNKTLNTLS